MLQSTDTLIPAFQSAAAAKQGPDIQYFWGGVWTLENAWNGALIPVDDLFSAEEKAHWINNFERSYDGKLWGVPWYLSGNPFVYNPKLFEKAGVDPKAVKTWDDLLAACSKLKASGVVPISGGLKDGWFGGWLFSILGRQARGQREGLHDRRADAGRIPRPQVQRVVEPPGRAEGRRLLERRHQLGGLPAGPGPLRPGQVGHDLRQRHLPGRLGQGPGLGQHGRDDGAQVRQRASSPTPM